MVIFGHNNKTSMVIIDYIPHRPKISIVIFETVPKFGLGLNNPVFNILFRYLRWMSIDII
jgi:hypothetical protein